MEITLVGSKGRVVKSPVADIVACTVAIPFLDWQIKGDLHPMSLCLKVPILGRISRTRIRMEWYSHSHQKCKHGNAQEWGCNSLVNQPQPAIIITNLLIFQPLPSLPPLHLSYTLQPLSVAEPTKILDFERFPLPSSASKFTLATRFFTTKFNLKNWGINNKQQSQLSKIKAKSQSS